MLVRCYYYDEKSKEYKITSLKEMKKLEYDDKREYLYRKERLFRYKNNHVPMVLVRKGLRQGFRRKGDNTGNHSNLSRGERESLTHQGNKEIL